MFRIATFSTLRGKRFMPASRLRAAYSSYSYTAAAFNGRVFRVWRGGLGRYPSLSPVGVLCAPAGTAMSRDSGVTTMLFLGVWPLVF